MQEVVELVVTLKLVLHMELEEQEVVVMVVQHKQHLDNQELQILAEAEAEEMILVLQVVQVEKV